MDELFGASKIAYFEGRMSNGDDDDLENAYSPLDDEKLPPMPEKDLKEL
jgi:hypothetical protein